MKPIYRNTCTLTAQEIAAGAQILEQEVDLLIAAQQQEYDTDYASINAPNDKKLISHIKNVAQEKLSFTPDMLLIIGIGGSNLGAAAVIQALFGTLYNDSTPIKTYFAETVDTDYTYHIASLAESTLSAGKKILINVISKSGTTTETVVLFQFFLEILKKYCPDDYHKYVVVTTDKNSALYDFAQQHHIAALIIPEKIGGRYSVFSAVGLFPLALLGVDIDALCAGALSALALCCNKDYTLNPAATSAIIIHALYKKNFVIHNSFIFDTALENMGKWYRQLMAESIGKLYDKNGNIVHNGILPTVSIGSTDLHSVAQLYLSGPYNIFTTFISIEKNKHQCILSYHEAFAHDAPMLQNKSFSTIMDAILEGTQKAYQKDQRPFVHIIIPEKTEYYLGQWMQIKMYEIIYLSFLMNINPFDQPQVELYKKETKKILVQKDTQ